MCQLIINNIKDLKPLNKEGKTPFDLAKEEGHEEICNLIKSAIKNQNETSTMALWEISVECVQTRVVHMLV